MVAKAGLPRQPVYLNDVVKLPREMMILRVAEEICCPIYVYVLGQGVLQAREDPSKRNQNSIVR